LASLQCSSQASMRKSMLLKSVISFTYAITLTLRSRYSRWSNQFWLLLASKWPCHHHTGFWSDSTKCPKVNLNSGIKRGTLSSCPWSSNACLSTGLLKLQQVQYTFLEESLLDMRRSGHLPCKKRRGIRRGTCVTVLETCASWLQASKGALYKQYAKSSLYQSSMRLL